MEKGGGDWEGREEGWGEACGEEGRQEEERRGVA